ncbi:ASCH domain-containing protein [[Acholeplasma] multilocale]|uniref:ASCH domain-containing protein n=1 Tax=[Acholeplasma] multilocale TaxID=264638 RepID=UPI00047A594A|nr:ASCH domain-containing protein [[Acholeplasma] multilocale]
MNLVISMNQTFFDQIKAGEKTVEYRFKFPRVNSEDKIYLFVPKTQNAIVGYIKPEEVIWLDKEEACDFDAKMHDDYDSNYNIMKELIGKREGTFAIKIKELVEFEKPMSFDYLDKAFGFKIPTGYQFLGNQDFQDDLNDLEK